MAQWIAHSIGQPEGSKQPRGGFGGQTRGRDRSLLFVNEVDQCTDSTGLFRG
jgi:hypothetical protein